MRYHGLINRIHRFEWLLHIKSYSIHTDVEMFRIHETRCNKHLGNQEITSQLTFTSIYGHRTTTTRTIYYEKRQITILHTHN